MKARQSAPSFNRRPVMDHVASLAISAIMAFVGCILLVPFIYVCFVLDMHFHRMTLFPSLLVMGALIGAPLFFAGIIGAITANRRGPVSSNIESDLARIRFDIENNR